VTNQASWQSSNLSVAAVNIAGVVTGISAGEVDITATYQSVIGRSHVILMRSTPTTFTVSGAVTDATSGGVLPGISIGSSTGQSAVTNSGGNYVMSGVPGGGVTLTASATGYQSMSKTAVITSDIPIDFVLARVASSPAPAPPAPAPNPTPAPPVGEPGLPARTAVGSAFSCALSSIVHPASCVNSMFGDAAALCNDGARSCSANNSGTCSSHNGVYCFVCPGPLCPGILAPAPTVKR
jgi:hypothetical protein